jgi:hypothetical protein
LLVTLARLASLGGVRAGIVGVEEIRKVDSMGIRTPFQQDVEQIPSPGAKGKVEGAVELEIGIVAVAEEQEEPGPNCRLQAQFRVRKQPDAVQLHFPKSPGAADPPESNVQHHRAGRLDTGGGDRSDLSDRSLSERLVWTERASEYHAGH